MNQPNNLVNKHNLKTSAKATALSVKNKNFWKQLKNHIAYITAELRKEADLVFFSAENQKRFEKS